MGAFAVSFSLVSILTIFLYSTVSSAECRECWTTSARLFSIQSGHVETGLRSGFEMAREAASANFGRPSSLKNQVYAPISLYASASLLSGQTRLADAPREGVPSPKNRAPAKSSSGPVVAAVSWQVASLRAEHGLAAPRVEDVGAGAVREQLQWERDRDSSWMLKSSSAVQAGWQRRFYALPASRSPRFRSLSGTYDRVPMIGTNQFLRNVDLGILQLAEIPLDSEGLSFFVLIPKEQETFLRLLESGEVLRNDFWKEAFARLKDSSLENTKVILPQFAITSDFEMRGARKVDSAPTSVHQMSFIQMDERGFRTNRRSYLDGIGDVIVPISDQHQVIADLPFFFAIGHRDKGLVLFVGQVVDPVQ